MAEVTPVPESYLRCVRRFAGDPETLSVEEYLGLKPFLEALVRPIAGAVFGYSGQAMVETPATLEEQLDPAFQRRFQLSAVPNADIRSYNTVRAVLFDVRAPSSEEVDTIFEKAKTRATAHEILTSGKRNSLGGRERRTRENTLRRDLADIQFEMTGSLSTLAISSSEVVQMPNRESDTKLRFALALDPGPAGVVLARQAEFIQTSAPLSKAVAFRPIFKKSAGITARDHDPLKIEFMSVERDNPGDPRLFVDRINEEMQKQRTRTKFGNVVFLVHPPYWDTGLFHQ